MLRLLQELIPASVLILLGSETILIVSCFLVASFLVVEVTPSVFLLYDGGLFRIGLTTVSILAALYFHDLYSQVRVRSKVLLVQQCCQVVGIAFLVQALISYTNPGWTLPRWLMILGSGMTLIVLVSWRIFYSAVVLRAMGEARMLFVGVNSLVEEIWKHFSEHPELGLRVVGYVEDSPEGGHSCQGVGLLGSISDLHQVVTRTQPDRIVVGMQERRQHLPVYDLLDLRLSGIRIEEVTTTYETTFKRLPLKELLPGQLIFSGELGPRGRKLSLQSVYSYLIAVFGAALFAPMMLMIAVAVRLSSPGPVMLRQKRVGLGGVPFTLYKFRSMYADAEAQTGAIWAARGDSRITPLGRWLRRLRLDELPQFINVLRGEMSIVGPRPERPEIAKILVEQIPYYRQRQCLKPGITGWAQINYKYGDTLEDSVKKLEYDLYYIKNLSVALDGYIIFQTLKTMLLSRGAQ